MRLPAARSRYDEEDERQTRRLLEQEITLLRNQLARLNNAGLGTAASATTLGSVAKKLEVFDQNGQSLGYIALYDAIT